MANITRVPSTFSGYVHQFIKRNPTGTYTDFAKEYPNAALKIRNYHFDYLKRKYTGKLTDESLKKIKKSNKLFSLIWQYEIKKFDENPREALLNLLQNLSAGRRANFDLVEIKLHDDENKWNSYLEIRES